MKKVISFALSFLGVLCMLYPVTDQMIRSEEAYRVIQDFESFDSENPAFGDLVTSYNAGISVETRSNYISHGKQSLKLSYAAGKQYPTVTFYGKAGDFAGDGIRFWYRAGERTQISSVSVYVENDDGTRTKKRLKTFLIPSAALDGCIVRADYSSAKDSLTAEEIKKIVGIVITFNLLNKPEHTSRNFWFDDIEVINPKLTIVDFQVSETNNTSVTLNWRVNEESNNALYYSTEEITADNFDMVEKLSAQSGKGLTEATVTGLNKGATYYFALRAEGVSGVDYAFASAETTQIPTKSVYDFEQSDSLSYYTTKVRSDSTMFYRINGGYGCSAFINTDTAYADGERSLGMRFGEYDKENRWPILYLYSPNFGDYSGKAISITASKTLNHEDQDIAVTCRIEVELEDKSVYRYSEMSDLLFKQGKSRQTVKCEYEKFYLSTDTTKTAKLTLEQTAQIVALRIYFNAPYSTKGQFTVYFDSISVIEPIEVERPVENLEFINERVIMQQGQTYSQQPGITPFNAVQNKLIWSTSDESIATVDPDTGTVSAVGMGIARITATAPSGVSANYKVVVKEDERGVLYRTLFDFEDGQIPHNIKLTGFKSRLDYSTTDTGVSLALMSAGRGTALLTVDDYAFFGEGISVWLYGNNAGSAEIRLMTGDGSVYSTTVGLDPEEGDTVLINYSSFRRNGTGTALDRDSIINLKKIGFVYSGNLYIDSIKVKNPLYYNVKTYPENDLGETGATVTDTNSALGDRKYQIEQVFSGSDYTWVIEGLTENEIISSVSDVRLYSLSFLDRNYTDGDLSSTVQISMPIPSEFYGLNNLWILHIDANGAISGVKSENDGMAITFNTARSGLYCLVSSSDTQYLSAKTFTESYSYEVTDDTEIPKEVPQKTAAQKNAKRIIKTQTITTGLFWWEWLLIVLGAVLLTGAVITVILIKKRKNLVAKRAAAENGGNLCL